LAPPKPSKKEVALALLEQSSIFVHLDPRRDKVVVPQSYRSQPELVLQFGLNMRIPVPDLEVGEEGIAGTLSFARRPFWCWIPWEAVFAIVDQERRGLAWPEDAPSDSKLGGAGQKPSTPPNPKRAHLRAVGPEETAPPVLEGEGTCKLCAIKWVEDASSCPVCGSSREEAFQVAETEASEPAPASPSGPPPAAVPSEPAPTQPPGLSVVESPVAEAPSTESPPDEPPPNEPSPTSPPKRPHLRLVKK
jgi:stringent starvation protein B